MRRSLFTILIALFAGALGAGVAVAATDDGRAPETTAVTEGVVPIQAAAQAPDARLVVNIGGNPFGSGFDILRAKGVAVVTNPADGIYCIRPNVPNMALTRIVPSVSIDWAQSPDNGVMAQWASNRRGCPRATISIVTLAQSGGNWIESNAVGFTVVVP